MTSGNTAEVGPMFRITEKISRIIKKVLATESSTITESLRRSLNELSLSISDPDKGTTTRTISFGTIQELVGYLKKQRAGSGGGEVDKNSTYLHEILEGSEIVVQAPQKREPVVFHTPQETVLINCMCIEPIFFHTPTDCCLWCTSLFFLSSHFILVSTPNL